MKKLTVIIVALALVFGLTACQSQDYKKAQELFAAGDLAGAETVFLALGEHEDSAAMVLKCRYGRALALYEAGKYAEALPMLQELGEYEDCKDLVTNCNYALAEAALAAKEYGKAADLYDALGDFKDCVEKETKARYFQLYQYVLDKNGQVTGKYTAADGKEYAISFLADGASDMVILKAVHKTTALANFTYEVNLAIPFEAEQGRMEAAFTMQLSFGGSTSTAAETFRASVALAECTDDIQISLEEYSKYEVDGSGKVTQKNDVTKAPTAELHTHFYNLIRGTAAVLEQLDLGVQLQDLGLTAWE